MLLKANIIGAILLALEGQLAFMAFGGLSNGCAKLDPLTGKTVPDFPCTTQKLFNENF
jgi:hypothetical protein